MSGVLHALTMTSSTGASDSLLASNVLLLKTIGTNNATNASFVDSSSNGFTVTRSGDVTQGAFSPYVPTGYWSAFFDGTGDRITAAHNTAFRLTGDFTVECWVNFVAVAGRLNWLVGCLDLSETGWMFRYTGTALRFYSGSFGAIDRSWTPTLGVWYHLAVTRSSGDIRMFIDGVQQGAAVSNSTSLSASTALAAIGGDPNFGSDTNAFISNLRIVKGSAVYTSNFTPPTSPLTAITNTVLLTCQDNRFIDRSSNNFTLTRTGDVSVRRFAPFGLSWDGSLGGSGYFDGNGDALTISSTSALQLNADFTVETWFNAESTGFYLSIFSTVANYYTTNGLRISTGEYNNTLQVATGATALINASTTFANNIWNHLALVRSGTSLTLYMNGTSVGSTTTAINFTADTFSIGTVTAPAEGGYWFRGHLANFRVVKGSAVYTAAFTPPTSPVTAITNTSLLLNFDNAAVYDATRASNLSLVGDTKTSTGQVKYATSSVIVDGVGDYLYPAVGMDGLSTGDFTIEGWIYPTNLTGPRVFYDGRPSGAQGAYPTLYINGTLRYFTQNADAIVGSSVSTNAWTHVAVCRSGSTTRLFQNGTQVGSVSDSVNYLAAAQRPLIGQNGFNNDSHFVGHLEDFRVSRTARYTAAFTPPTRALPVTAG